MLVTPACYAHITQKLMSIANGKVIAILEVPMSNIFYEYNLLINITPKFTVSTYATGKIGNLHPIIESTQFCNF